MTDVIWAAAGIRMPRLTAKEREYLTMLRVTALAADPTEVKLLVRRADVLTLLTVVDRWSEGPFVESPSVVKNGRAGVVGRRHCP
jgi:hypothetical protein